MKTKVIELILIAILASATATVACSQEPAAYEGPIIDAINSRIEVLRQEQEGFFQRIKTDRLEAEAERKGLLESIREIRAEREGLFSEIRQATAERKTILESLREFRAERVTLIESIRTIGEERQGIFARLSSLAKGQSDLMGRWTPVQNLVDRLNGLILKLFVTLFLVVGFLLVVLVIAAVTYRKIMKAISVIPGLKI